MIGCRYINSNQRNNLTNPIHVLISYLDEKKIREMNTIGKHRFNSLLPEMSGCQDDTKFQRSEYYKEAQALSLFCQK